MPLLCPDSKSTIPPFVETRFNEDQEFVPFDLWSTNDNEIRLPGRNLKVFKIRMRGVFVFRFDGEGPESIGEKEKGNLTNYADQITEDLLQFSKIHPGLSWNSGYF